MPRIEESNRFRKRYKGVEFTSIRTKGDARAGDVSSEDEEKYTHTKEAHRKTGLTKAHHQECILDYINHTVNVCVKALCIIEALDGVSTDILVEIKHL